MSDRIDGRSMDQLRPVEIKRNYLRHAEGSALITMGGTTVLCSASVDEYVPSFLKGSGKGWVTAEYGMLPRSTNTRVSRDGRRGSISGRTQEIQRLIGRSLRAVFDLGSLGERSILIDCDVLEADGGTRTASITGSYVALYDAVRWLQNRNLVDSSLIKDSVAAISVGIIDGTPMLDLCYAEDSNADVDMNIVMTGSGAMVEIQGTAEQNPFTTDQLNTMLDLGRQGIEQLVTMQKQVLEIS
ncbi:MAG: ribonuclease PH [Candidatus Latescibacteria bacterium]|nr:ribonuclease PH [Candidatus Latescibacterota bacterium]MDP7238657.1 ribonuclease PH [Candidatus Latescibacterota bacterium]